MTLFAGVWSGAAEVAAFLDGAATPVYSNGDLAAPANTPATVAFDVVVTKPGVVTLKWSLTKVALGYGNLTLQAALLRLAGEKKTV